MKTGLKRLCIIGIVSLPMGVVPTVSAQQPSVTDLSGGSSGGGTFYDQTATRAEAGGDLVLFNRLKQNQEELRRLRGQVEELRHQLEQLRQQTRQQYLDMDDRLSSLSSDAAGGSASSSAPSSNSSGSASSGGNAGANDSAGREAYQAAFAKVQNRDFAAARQAFETFIADYPQSGLAANAHYWLGELHSAESDLEAASAAFRKVIDGFPDSNKVPDALYKLGLLKARQGNIEASGELLDQVQSQYPDSSAASLAEDFQKESGS
ncbi:tol-pal system protein YbgF [Halomonas sp. 18H]|uniref:tol-pal system protein YbgF n=1 Tax=Halomonas almeriensis TaxID=308163 RepID=UPI00222E4103|nr:MULTISPECIES: tol-pal system protein YbgF [Halomonas]MCW4151847.1 tol-pal system protein YbgF [Halomonas sp. 18H]MDN3554093.1 tol-pal system protein YbgF [Halomonas almeriensis]